MKTKIKLESNHVLISVFLSVIVLFGVLNLRNLMDFYINDVPPTTEWTSEMGDKLETDYTSVFEGKSSFVNVNGLVRKILHQREMNGITKLNNGWLADIDSNPDETIVLENARRVNELNRKLHERGIEFLYVITPDTISKYDEQLPFGVTDYTNSKLDAFVNELSDVDYIDMRKAFHEEGINQYRMFYKTDHHWNVEAGMFAASKILAYAEEKLNMQIDERICDADYYETETYERWHLGSRGQRVGKFYAGIDDFTIMYPKFETNFVRMTDGETGNFEQIFISYDALQDKNNTSRYTYDATYKYSITGEFLNTHVANDKKLAVISDSMGRVVNPYLAMAFESMCCTTLEEMNEAFLEEYEPDMIVILLHPSNVKNGNYLNVEK